MLSTNTTTTAKNFGTIKQDMLPRELIAGFCLCIVVPYCVFLSMLMLLSFS